MAHLLLLTRSKQSSVEVLPALALLAHQVKILPAEASALLDAPPCDAVIVDGRHDLAQVRSLTRVIRTTGIECPLILILTEGGLAVAAADWGMDDVILTTAGPAELEARLRLGIGRVAAGSDSDAENHVISSSGLVVDDASYTAKLHNRSLVHVRRLRAKLGVEHETLIGTVRNVGYRFVAIKPESSREATDTEATTV